MNQQEINELLAQRRALESMIAGTPEQDVIDLGSLTARLEVVNAEIADHSLDTRLPAKARLTFRGRPVVGSHGIFADFGLAATKIFTDAVALMAASFGTELAATGPIPNRSQNQLIITSTAVGSFGFELEEHCEGFLPPEEDSAVAQALAKTQALLQGSASGTDDELTDEASGKDPRAVNTLREFLKKLLDNGAVCTVSVGEKAIVFNDLGEVQKSLTRLGQDNIHEEPTAFQGEFQGALPKHRTFEFKVKGTGDVIAGKIGQGITDPSAINRHLAQPTDIQLIATRVGQGRPRYVLKDLPDWK